MNFTYNRKARRWYLDHKPMPCGVRPSEHMRSSNVEVDCPACVIGWQPNRRSTVSDASGGREPCPLCRDTSEVPQSVIPEYRLLYGLRTIVTVELDDLKELRERHG